MGVLRLSKGQVFTADLIASIAVFSSFLVAFGVLWNVSVKNSLETGPMEGAEGRYTFSLLRSEGSPPNWNTTNVKIPGVYSNGLLDRNKFLRLKNLSQSRLVGLLRSQGFRLKATYLNGTALTVNGTDLVVSTSQIPENRSVQTFRSLTLDSRTRKRVKLAFYRWTKP